MMLVLAAFFASWKAVFFIAQHGKNDDKTDLCGGVRINRISVELLQSSFPVFDNNPQIAFVAIIVQCLQRYFKKNILCDKINCEQDTSLNP